MDAYVYSFVVQINKLEVHVCNHIHVFTLCVFTLVHLRVHLCV